MMQRLHSWHRHKLIGLEIDNEQTSESLSFRATDMTYSDAVLDASTDEREKNRVLVTNQFVQQNK